MKKLILIFTNLFLYVVILNAQQIELLNVPSDTVRIKENGDTTVSIEFSVLKAYQKASTKVIVKGNNCDASLKSGVDYIFKEFDTEGNQQFVEIRTVRLSDKKVGKLEVFFNKQKSKYLGKLCLDFTIIQKLGDNIDTSEFSMQVIVTNDKLEKEIKNPTSKDTIEIELTKKNNVQLFHDSQCKVKVRKHLRRIHIARQEYALPRTVNLKKLIAYKKDDHSYEAYLIDATGNKYKSDSFFFENKTGFVSEKSQNFRGTFTLIRRHHNDVNASFDVYIKLTDIVFSNSIENVFKFEKTRQSTKIPISTQPK